MDFCDLICEFAAWPEEESLDGSGSCKTFKAIYCEKNKRHVHKNMPCHEKSKRKPPDNPGGFSSDS
jgi:hypothetical protein